jgi:hypothetical protein
MKIKTPDRNRISCSMIVTLLLFSITGCNHYCISGTVVNEYGEPVPYAEVTVCGLTGAFPIGDKPVSSKGIADADGNFQIKAKSATYISASSPDKKYTADLVVPVKEEGNRIVLKKDASEQ